MKKETAGKNTGRKIGLALISVIVILAVYLMLACLPYSGKLTVSDNTKATFSVENFYAQTIGHERVMMLNDPENAFFYRIDTIRKAKETILFSTFLFYQGFDSDILVGALIDAAKRGVKVYVLIDKWSEIPNSYINCFIDTPNIHFYIFNPLNILNPRYINVSLHDKCLIADDTYFIIGGRNIADRYFMKGADYFQSDLDVLIYNTDTDLHGSISQAQEYFRTLIDSALTKNYTTLSAKNAAQAESDAQSFLSCFQAYQESEAGDEEISYTDLTVPTNRITLITNGLIDGTKKEPVVAYTLLNLAKNSETITLQSPFVVLTNDSFSLLKDAVNGKNATLITNSLSASNDRYSYSNYLINRERYLGLGIHIYEDQNDNISFHYKCYLFDDRLSAIGSFNLDERSIRVDTESIVVIDSPEFNSLIRRALQDNINQSLLVNPETNTYEVSADLEPANTTWLKKISYVIWGHIMGIVDFLL